MPSTVSLEMSRGLMHPAGSARSDMASPSSLGTILTELLHGFRRPAVVIDEHGTVLYTNAAAIHALESRPRTPDPSPMDLQGWRRLATFTAEDRSFCLAMPDHSSREPSPPLPALPPRLAKIASLVVSGCTDKQISARTGLSFSTVRTYVRQVYRRLGVHNRVALVHAFSLDAAPPAP